MNVVISNAKDLEFSEKLIAFMLKQGYNLKEVYVNSDLRIHVFSK